MAKHKTAELEGVLLDAAVATAEGLNPRLVGGACMIPAHEEAEYPGEMLPWPVSSDWAYGGPIIGEQAIELERTYDRKVWTAIIDLTRWVGTRWVGGDLIKAKGPTPLIAAMRAYTASVFGEEVEL